MPLSEFLRLAVEKLEASKKKSCSNDLSSRTENEVVELVWEDGQVMMQGQSSRLSMPSNAPRARSPLENSSTVRTGKFGRVDSLLNDISAVMPSGQLDLSQNDEMVPWLSYPVNDGLQDYCSELLPDNVGANGMPARNTFLSGENGNSSDQAISSLDNGRDFFKFSASKTRPLCSWLRHQGQTSDTSLGSGVSNILSNSASNCQDTMFGNCAQDRDTVNNSASKKIERQNIALQSKNPSLLNFSNFSRPPAQAKSNLPDYGVVPPSVSSRLESVEVKEKDSSAPTWSNPVKSMFIERLNDTQKDIESRVPSAPTTIQSRQLVAKEHKETFVSARTENFRQEASMKNDKALVQSSTAYSSKGVPDGERTVEPMVGSSSVGSGSSADIVSYGQPHNSKRKSRDIEESECHSDDIGTELIGVKKATLARGGTASKRSRAAEVHNLSERRRRDRINDKMRALQELIPNCNKADKASMLDEAIEYLKNLQHQLQDDLGFPEETMEVMSMRAGLCMPHMIFPRGTQHIYPAHLPHFSPMGFANGVSPQCPIFPLSPMQGVHFPSAPGPNNFPITFGPNIPLYGHPSQGHHISVPKTPLVPLTRRPQATSAVGSSDLRVSRNNKVSCTSPNSISENPATNKNSEYTHNAEASSSINRRSNQVKSRNEIVDPSVKVRKNSDEGTDFCKVGE